MNQRIESVTVEWEDGFEETFESLEEARAFQRPDLKAGDLVKITANPQNYEQYSVGDIVEVERISRDGGVWVCPPGRRPGRYRVICTEAEWVSLVCREEDRKDLQTEPLKVGDKVRITQNGKHLSRTGRYSDSWIPQMDKTVGEAGTVALMTPGYVRLRLPDGECWNYPEEVLEKIDP